MTHHSADEVTLNADAQSEMKNELDDERRDVPEGWVRAFDRKSGHHFYAPADPSVTGQSTWIHPYNSPSFLASLPAGHPANPASSAAQAAKQKAADEAAKSTESAEKKPKGLLAMVGKLVSGDGPSSEDKRAIQDAEENFIMRREALKKGDLAAIGTNRKYAADPFAYTAPSEPLNRHTSSEIQYAFGYQGGYQRKYTPVLGYDRIAKPSGSMIGTAMDSWLQGAGAPVAGHNVKSGYGYNGNR